MDTATRRLEITRQFAAALDACDYLRAAEFLAGECRYERPGKTTLVGPQEICDSYRDSDTRARRAFDSVAYASEAGDDRSGGVRLTFIDELCRSGAIHVFRCEQIVYFDASQKIARIELRELPGQRERLDEFCAAHGVRLQ